MPSRESASNAHWFLATMIGSDLEGLRSLAAAAGRKQTPFHGADGADALQGSASDDHRFLATMTGSDLEGCGPSQPRPAVNKHHFTAPTERTPSRGRPATTIGSWQQEPVAAWRTT